MLCLSTVGWPAWAQDGTGRMLDPLLISCYASGSDHGFLDVMSEALSKLIDKDEKIKLKKKSWYYKLTWFYPANYCFSNTTKPCFLNFIKEKNNLATRNYHW